MCFSIKNLFTIFISYKDVKSQNRHFYYKLWYFIPDSHYPAYLSTYSQCALQYNGPQ